MITKNCSHYTPYLKSNILGDRRFFHFKLGGKKIDVLLVGRIDNYYDLRKMVSSDGICISCEEHLIAFLYLAYGDHFVEKIRGIFVIVCNSDDSLFIYRDRSGIKTLYYALLNQDFIFAFDFKSILPHLTSVDIDTSILCEHIIFGFPISEGKTIFNKIQELPKGHFIKFSKGNLKVFPFQENSGLVCNRFHLQKIIGDNIQNVLNSTVRVNEYVGVCISGGLDSSIVAITVAQLHKNINSYTLTSSNANIDDVKFARKVAKSLHVYHEIINIDLSDIFKNIIGFIKSSETPGMSGILSSDNGDFSQYILLKNVKENLVFSGDGADELFCGYRWCHKSPSLFLNQLYQGYKSIFSSTEAIDSFFMSSKSTSQKVYDLFLHHGLNYQSIILSKNTDHEIYSPFISKDIIMYANGKSKYSIAHAPEKRILRLAYSKLLTNYHLLEVIDRPKLAMPTATASVTNNFHLYLNEKANDKGPFASFFTKKYEKVLFDIFAYIFLIKKGNFICDSVENLLHDDDFIKTMYN